MPSEDGGHVSVKMQYLTHGRLTCYPDDCGCAWEVRGSGGYTAYRAPTGGAVT